MVIKSNTLDFIFLQDGSDGTPGATGADGQSLYTWVKYSQNANGSNPTDNPDGAVYIGIAYNKTSATESTNPADYSWSLIKGEDGQDGANGLDAYTVILTNENISFSTDSNYVPLANQSHTCDVIVYNGTTAVTDYTIGIITSPTGITASVTNKVITLSAAPGTAIANASGSINVPITTGGITFNKVITYSCSTRGANGTNGQNGQDGQDGTDGKSITSIVTEYAISTSDQTNNMTRANGQQLNDWTQTKPTDIVDGEYIWTRFHYYYDDNTSSVSNEYYDSTITGISSILDTQNGTIRDSVWQKTYVTVADSSGQQIQKQMKQAVVDNTISINGITSTVSQVQNTLNTATGDISDLTGDVSDLSGSLTTLQTTIEQTAEKIYFLVSQDSTSSSITLTPAAIQAITDQFIVEDADGNTTIISGGQLTTDNIVAHNGFSFVNLYDGTFRFGQVGNTAISWDGTNLVIGQATQDSIAQAAVQGGLMITSTADRPLQATSGENLYNENNVLIEADGVLEITFDNLNNTHTGGWTWFNGQKINIPYFSVDLAHDYIPKVNGYIVNRGTTQYIVWFDRDASAWYGKRISPTSNLLTWQWGEDTDAILMSFSKDDHSNATYEKFTPAKTYSTIKVDAMLQSWGVDGRISETTTINGGNIATGTITANALSTDAIMSQNYEYVSGYYAKSGTFLNLQNGSIRSKSFYIDENGNARFRGYIEATSGRIGGFNITNTGISKLLVKDTVESRTYYDYDLHTWVTLPSVTTRSDTYTFILSDPGDAVESKKPVIQIGATYKDYVSGESGSYFDFRVTADGYLHTDGADINNAIISNARIANTYVTSGMIGGFHIEAERMISYNTQLTASEVVEEASPGVISSVTRDGVYREVIGLQSPEAPMTPGDFYNDYVFWVSQEYLWNNAPSEANIPFRIKRNGQLYAEGAQLPNATVTSPSDIRLKTNIQDTEVKSALDLIDKIDLRSFDWKEDGRHQKIGFIADELEKLDQRLVTGGGDISKGIDSFYLLAYVVKAVQELHEEIKELRNLED